MFPANCTWNILPPPVGLKPNIIIYSTDSFQFLDRLAELESSAGLRHRLSRVFGHEFVSTASCMFAFTQRQLSDKSTLFLSKKLPSHKSPSEAIPLVAFVTKGKFIVTRVVGEGDADFYKKHAEVGLVMKLRDGSFRTAVRALKFIEGAGATHFFLHNAEGVNEPYVGRAAAAAGDSGECVLCRARFADEAARLRHAARHCHDCSADLNSAEALIRHVLAAHSRAAACHRCPSCPSEFTTAANLARHSRAQHQDSAELRLPGGSGGGAAQCAVCPTSFGTGPELAAHVRSAHKMRLRNCARTETVLYEEIDVELLQEECTVESGSESEPECVFERSKEKESLILNRVQDIGEAQPPPEKVSKGARRGGRVSEEDFVDVVDIDDEEEEEAEVTEVQSQAVQIQKDLLQQADVPPAAVESAAAESSSSSESGRDTNEVTVSPTRKRTGEQSEATAAAADERPAAKKFKLTLLPGSEGIEPLDFDSDFLEQFLLSRMSVPVKPCMTITQCKGPSADFEEVCDQADEGGLELLASSHEHLQSTYLEEQNCRNTAAKCSMDLKQVSSLSSGASLDKPISNSSRTDTGEDPIDSDANNSGLVAGTTSDGESAQWVLAADGDEAANPDLDEIVIKQELDTTGEK